MKEFLRSLSWDVMAELAHHLLVVGIWFELLSIGKKLDKLNDRVNKSNQRPYS